MIIKILLVIATLIAFLLIALYLKFLALLIGSMNASKIEAENLIKTLFNHGKNVNSR